jgi:hypothetical protein
MHYWIGKAKIVISITYLKWRYVEDYDFYDVILELDNFSRKRIFINSHRLNGLEMPKAVASLLRADINCIPIRGVEKSVDKR